MRFLATWRWIWGHRDLVLGIAIVVLLAHDISVRRRAATAEAMLRAADERAQQEEKVRKANVPLVQVAPAAAVAQEADDAVAGDAELRAQRDRLEAQVGKLRAFIALHAQTDEVKAHGPARPGEPPAGTVSAADASPATAGAALAGIEPSGPTPAVLLRAGDGMRFSLLGAGYEGDRGAKALLLTIGALRAADDVEIARGPLSVPLSRIFEAPPSPAACRVVPERAYRIGVMGGGTARGWVGGGAASYRVDLWGWQPEAAATVTAGPGGIAALGGLLF